MNISELLSSTYRLGERRRPSYVFSNKPFGAIFAFNKSVVYKPNNSIVEISMYIKAATELDKTAHKVSVALQGVDISEYTQKDLFDMVRMSSKFSHLEDEELLEMVYSEQDIVAGKFIIQASRNKFLLIDKRIPMTSQIRVKCSCFSGDTKVILADGEKVTLKSLEGKTNFNVTAYNKEHNKFEVARGIKCELKEENTKVLKVTLSDGTEILSTPQHRFLTSNGMWLEAQELTEGDVLRSAKKLNYSNIKNHLNRESCYTYIYLDPRKKGDYDYGDISFDYEPFYVGIGSGIVKDIDNNRCYTTMSEIYESGFTPIFVKQKVCIDKYVALQLKQKLITKIGLDSEPNGTLVNRKIVEEKISRRHKQGYKVVSVIEQDKKEDVYCITTEGLGNFVVATSEENSGIVVENCADYYYTFAYYNAEHKAHIGMKPPKYTSYRAIAKGGDFRPVRNPNRYPGVCKHILMFLALLMNGRVINPSNKLLDKFSENKKRFDIYTRKDMTEMLDKVSKELKAQNQKIKEQRQANKDYDAREKQNLKDFRESQKRRKGTD